MSVFEQTEYRFEIAAADFERERLRASTSFEVHLSQVRENRDDNERS